MLLHLFPNMIFSSSPFLSVRLESLLVPEIDLFLTEKELSTGKPYPNKMFNIGFLKSRKAKIGLIVETQKQLNDFSTIYKWKVSSNVSNEECILTHTIINHVVDHEFDFVSQSSDFSCLTPSFSNRTHEKYKELSPMQQMPLFAPFESNRKTNELITKKKTQFELTDPLRLNWGLQYSDQVDELFLLTLEPERLKDESNIFYDRFPTF